MEITHFNYNTQLHAACKKLQGRWDPDSKKWTFDPIVADMVEELDKLYNTNIVTIEITALRDISEDCGAIEFAGYKICRAFGRDSGAKLCDNIYHISGVITSGGSIKNWATIIRKGAKFRLKISKNLLTESEYFNIKIIGEVQ